MIKQAIDFIRDNSRYSTHDINLMVCKAMNARVPVATLYPSLRDNILDLLDEFSVDQELDDDWWADKYDINQIIEML